MKAEEKNRIAQAILDQVDRLTDDLKSINDDIFARPETCYQERYAVERLTGYLAANGFEIETPHAGLPTAFRATHRQGSDSPRIALLAEYDALPDIGHACGHSMIGASSAIAAVALRRAGVDFSGSIVVVGTPAEEGGGGKVAMLKVGAFDDIDAAMMLHPSNKTRVIARMFAVNDLLISFKGKASHAAAFPEEGINALDAGVLFYNGVSMERQAMKSSMRVHGIFVDGGQAPNIIPERCSLRFYIRALKMSDFHHLKNRITDIAHGVARATKTEVSIESKGYLYEPFRPNYALGEAFKANMARLGLVEDKGFSETDEIGSSDIGNLSGALPSLHPEFAIGPSSSINHSRAFLEDLKSDRALEALTGMTKTLTLTLYDLLTDAELLSQARSEFEAMRERAD